jgi:hypothetical protein
MKYRPCITSVSLIVALTGLSPVMAADTGIASGHTRIHSEILHPENKRPIKLSHEQMDHVSAGFTDLPKVLYKSCYGGTCAAYLSNGAYISWFNIWGGSSFTDSSGRTVGNSGPGSQ